MATYKMTKELEEKVKKLKEELRSTVNRTELAKWFEAGEPYVEHEEVLLFKNELTTHSESVGKSLIYIILSHNQ
jgi:hypothetical protein